MGRSIARTALVLCAFAPAELAANSFSHIEVREGVEIGIRWRGAAAAPVSFPVVEGQPFPHGDNRLVVRVSAELLDPEAREHVFQLRRSKKTDTYHHVGQLADGALAFEVPIDFSDGVEPVDIEGTLLIDRRPLGLDFVNILNMTYLPDGEHLNVVSVNRYPRLSWNDCPAPCFERPAGLQRITQDEWRRALSVVERGRGGMREVDDFEVTLSPERPASIVYVVDTSGSILEEQHGDLPQAMLAHFAAFPDEAYGGDEVRRLDRIGMLFFNADVLGYYQGHDQGRPTSALAAEPRFFSPDELAPDREAFCGAHAGPVARFDDAWLTGARQALDSAGYLRRRREPRSTREAICVRGSHPAAVLDRYRDAVRQCQREPGCAVAPAGTDVLTALTRASRDLDMLAQEARTPAQVRDNQQAIVLISDGIDHEFVRSDDRARLARFQEMKNRVLQGKRFFFVDVHSDLVLTKMIARALGAEWPLVRALFAGIDAHVIDSELSLLMHGALARPEDAALRDGLLSNLGDRPMVEVAPGSPALAGVLDGIFRRGLAPYAALMAGVDGLEPHQLAAILKSRSRGTTSIDDPWLRRLAELTGGSSRSALRERPAAGQVGRALSLVKSRTVDRFHDLAQQRDGLAITARSCTHALDDGRLLTGPACAFREILRTLRGVLLVKYQPPGDHEIDDVTIRLTEFGERLLRDHGMTGARIDRAASR